jgi:hypothetical protein
MVGAACGAAVDGDKQGRKPLRGQITCPARVQGETSMKLVLTLLGIVLLAAGVRMGRR